MSLVVNTNVSSLTAQRALAYADSLQGEAMTRLSTGSKLNSASDDAAGLAIASRMTAQVNGLNMAVKNANDGIALTQSIEGALVEVSDMVQRIRELSVQASNDTNTDSDRAFIQEEVNLLIAEITRISSNTRYNGQLVLDGSFTNRQMQVGTEGGETITVNVDSVASDMLGAYEITGDRIEAFNGNGAGSYGNITDAADDIIINGNSLSKTIDVAAGDSARAVAAKINNVSGETGVTAEAKTYALLSSEYATDETYSVLINNKTTGSFVLSNSNVLDAVDKINAISGSTGVTATATTDNKVRLYASDGADILIESQSTGTALKVQSMSHDGESVQPAKYWHKALTEEAGAASGIGNATYTLLQTSTNQSWQFTLAAGTPNEPTAAELQAAINSISGVSGFNVSDNGNQTNPSSVVVTATESFGDFEIYSGTSAAVAANKQTGVGYGTVAAWATNGDGDAPSSSSVSYVLRNLSTGTNYDFTVTAAAAGVTATEIQTGLNAIDGVSGFVVEADATNTDTFHIYGPQDFGNWTMYDTTNTTIDANVTYDAGDLNGFDVGLAAGGSSNDAATVQGTLSLKSSSVFSVTQSDEATNAVTDPATATGGTDNDNYFVTQAATLNTVSNVDLRTQAKASAALAVLDGAIEKISLMRATLGAVENRLDHTVSNLMNISENTESARSRIQDADFAAESAKLAKAQVLKQAGVGMLAQANAGSQLVLQLLQ